MRLFGGGVMAECRTCIHAYVNGLYVYCRLKKTWIPLDKTKTGCNNYAVNPTLKPKNPIGTVPVW